MGVETALIASAIIAAAGTGYSAYSSEQARKDARGRTKAEEARLREQQAARDANIGQVREAYGVGSSATAQANAKTLSDSINEYYNNYLSNSLRTVDDQYAGASRTSRQNLARVGQLGSSLDTASRSGNLADYLRGRQQAVASAATAKDNLAAQLTSQRIGLENQISGGTVANPDLTGVASQQQAAIKSAQSQIPASAIGSLFNTAGSTYFNGTVQDAMGNQGLAAFGFSNNNNRGRIS